MNGGAEEDESLQVKDEYLIAMFAKKFQFSHGPVNVAAKLRPGHGVADDVHPAVVMHKEDDRCYRARSHALGVANRSHNRQNEQHNEIVQSSQSMAGLIHPLPQEDQSEKNQ